MLFYTHLIPLSAFLGIAPQLLETGYSLSFSTWFLVALSIISQFYCTNSVHTLATTENSVTITFILTLRKFVSLLISSIVFKNNLTLLHVFGTVFVVVGTIIYFDCFARKQQKPVSLKND